MLRRIIRIDESKCDGCGLCVSTCHEGCALLARSAYCLGGGLYGFCYPGLPAGFS
ncbi:MAG: 4Fe-4S binding protein [Acetomicrobium sp.]